MAGSLIECLESRQLLSGDLPAIEVEPIRQSISSAPRSAALSWVGDGPEAILWSGALTVFGTVNDDHIRIYTPDEQPATLLVDMNGTIQTFPLSDVRHVIEVFAREGNDTIDVENVGVRVLTDAGEGDTYTLHSGPMICAALSCTDPRWLHDRPPLLIDSIPSAEIVDRKLIITGTALGDVIRVSKKGDKLIVTFASPPNVNMKPGHVMFDDLRAARFAFNRSDFDSIRIEALGGNDLIQLDRPGQGVEVDGGGGNDIIHGGKGNDTLSGGEGNDWIHGGFGNDLISGGSGDDVLRGGAGNDTLHGDDGDDKLLGGRGRDTFDGGAGKNVLKQAKKRK